MTVVSSVPIFTSNGQRSRSRLLATVTGVNNLQKIMQKWLWAGCVKVDFWLKLKIRKVAFTLHPCRATSHVHDEA